jgi:aryl carrier-like protein
MIPAAFVEMEHLPLTPNGKLDRRALPEPGGARPELEQGYVAPETAAERVLAEIWQGVLGLERVGIQDNFFALGGDSILSIQVIARAAQAGWRLSPRQLFQHQTIAALAAVAVPVQAAEVVDRPAQLGAAAPMSLVKLSQAELERLAHTVRDIEDMYPLSPMQQGLLFHSLASPQSGLYTTQVSCTLRHLNVAAFIKAWEQTVQRHAVLRTSFVWAGLEVPHQVVYSSCGLPVERLDWTTLPSSEHRIRLERYLEADRTRGFDLGLAPLMRLILIRTNEHEHHFVWSHHHALLDGWSVPALIAEVVCTYDALIRNETASLPARRPYRDYIAWLMNRQPREAESFWRKALGNFRGASSPKSEAHPAASGKQRFANHLREISPGLDQNLRSLSRRSQLTLNTLVQGALALALRDLTGSSDVLFGATVSGRPAELEGVESMIGLFLQAIPVPVRIASQMPALAWLKQIQEDQAEARQFAYASLADIQKWGEIRRGALFDVLLVFQNLRSDSLGAISESTLAADDLSAVSHSHYPLTITVTSAAPMRIGMEYDVAHHTRDTVTRLSSMIETALSMMCSMAETANLRQFLRALDRHPHGEHHVAFRPGPGRLLPIPAPLTASMKEVNRD